MMNVNDSWVAFMNRAFKAVEQGMTMVVDVILYRKRVERQKHLQKLIKWTGKSRLKKKHMQELREITAKIERTKGANE